MLDLEKKFCSALVEWMRGPNIGLRKIFIATRLDEGF